MDIIRHYNICIKGKEPLISDVVTMIEPITGIFEVKQYRNKKATTIVNLVETTWMVWYTRPVKITHDQEGEFLGHKFKHGLIENEYESKNMPDYSRNPQVNTII